MLTLPLPRDKKGGEGYRTILNYLKENYKAEDGYSIFDEGNQHALKRAIEILRERMSREKDGDYIMKNDLLLSLLYQTNQFKDAEKWAEIAKKKSSVDDVTLPSYIWGVQSLPAMIRRWER